MNLNLSVVRPDDLLVLVLQFEAPKTTDASLVGAVSPVKN
jgi:hypothetical protein